MSAIWDGDTGHVTIKAAKDGTPVNLTGATCSVIARHAESGAAAITLDEVPAESNRVAGVVVANAAPLTPGSYRLVMRVSAGGVTTTYPSAGEDSGRLDVRPDIDD